MTDTYVNRLLIEEIRQKHKISDYLASKGINPVDSRDDRVAYLCPIHSDSNPSFMLYNNKDGVESFYCFGCLISGDIISLYRAVEGLSWKATLDVLGRGIEITPNHQLNVTISDLYKELEQSHAENLKNPFGDFSMVISAMGSLHLRRTDCDEEELEFLESLYKVLDKYIAQWDIGRVEKTYKYLSGDNEMEFNPFESRMMLWRQKCEMRLQQKLRDEESRDNANEIRAS